MQIITLVVGQVRTNCYLVEDSGEIGIIDPGDDGNFLIQKIQDMGVEPVWVLATHGHFDHILAVTEIALTYKIPFYLHPNDNFFLRRAKETAEYFLGIPADPVLVDPTPITEKTKLSIGKVNFQVIKTPGHSPGGICLYDKKDKALFSGDLIFSRGLVGRTDFEYCSKEDLKRSVKRVLKLPEDTVVYPGHGELTTIGQSRNDLRRII